MTVPPPTSGRWLVACDLDQTLIYSRRAFRLPEGVPEPVLRIAEYLDGEPLSYLTEVAADGLRVLAGRLPVVPVTTRTLAQYRRVDLGFAPQYAIAANGGHLLIDGLPDPSWDASVRRRVAACAAPLAEIRQVAEKLLREGADGDWIRTVRDADDFFVYLVATERAAIPDLTAFVEELELRGWSVSVQGRKVYLVPQALTKEAALAEVMRRTGSVSLAAAGDSLLDLGMLTAADAAVRPAHGELHEQGIERAHVAVTDRSGLLGGQELVGMLLQLVTRSGDPGNADVSFIAPAG